MREEWRPIDGYEGRYEVSSLGRCRSLDRPVVYNDGRSGRLKGRMLRLSFSKAHGYRMISFPNQVKKTVHRCVAEAFLSKPKSEFYVTVNHINGDKLDNRADNLQWATYKENNNHARENRLCVQDGQNCNLSKYSDQLVSAMKKVHRKYKPSYVELGKLFGMSSQHAGEIIRGKSRKIR